MEKLTNNIKSIGRKEKPITFDASGDSLIKGAIFNENIHKSFGTKNNGILKGLYHFKSHVEANEHMEICIAKKIARKSLS